MNDDIGQILQATLKGTLIPSIAGEAGSVERCVKPSADRYGPRDGPRDDVSRFGALAQCAC
jgi:hypothetical protein